MNPVSRGGGRRLRRACLCGVALSALIAAGAAQAGPCALNVSAPGMAAREPVRYETIVERVMVEPARRVARVVPPVMRTIEERYLVEPEQISERVVPAVVRPAPEQVMLAPARREWRTMQDGDRMTGAWVDIPAVYETRLRAVIEQPARTVTEMVPARYGVRVRTIEVEPARTVYEEAPPVWAMRKRFVEAQPAGENCALLPPRS